MSDLEIKEATLKMAKHLEEAMYGLPSVKPGDLVVYEPTSTTSSKRIKNLTVGRVYKVVDYRGHWDDMSALPIENDTGMLNWYKRKHFRRARLDETYVEMTLTVEPEVMREVIVVNVEDAIAKYVITQHPVKKILMLTVNGVAVEGDSAGHHVLFAGDIQAGDKVDVQYIKGRFKRKTVIKQQQVAQKQKEEQRKLDFMEELRRL